MVYRAYVSFETVQDEMRVAETLVLIKKPFLGFLRPNLNSRILNINFNGYPVFAYSIDGV